LIHFEKAHAVYMALIAALGLCIAYATYRHTIERDEASATPPTTIHTITKPVEKEPEKQPEKEPERSVEQQKPPELPPVETPKGPEPLKEEPKPLTFWGYLPASPGRAARPSIQFQVNSCPISRTLVTCIMTATSPHYDRQLYFYPSTTTITDSEGDVFALQVRSFAPLQLDRDAPLPFKLEFPVNKDLVKPIAVRLNGSVPNSGDLQNALFYITSPRPPSGP
jgi:hypothetical protein